MSTARNLTASQGPRVGRFHPRRREHISVSRQQLRHAVSGGRVRCDLHRSDPYADDPNRPSGPDQCDPDVLEPDRGAFLHRSSACRARLISFARSPRTGQSNPCRSRIWLWSSRRLMGRSTVCRFTRISVLVSVGFLASPLANESLARMGVRREGQHCTMEHQPDRPGRMALS